MAAAEEQAKVLIPDSAASSAPTSVDAISKFVSNALSGAFASTNMIAAKKTESVRVSLPQLTESVQAGFVKGTPLDVTCCLVGRHLVEKNTAYDFIMMSNAAAKDGITLRIMAAFRPMHVQQGLWAERMGSDGKPNAVGRRLGAAAPPGTSNHQSGIALDIDVGMTTDDYRARRWSAAFLWLKGDPDVKSSRKPPYETTGRAVEFGFAHFDGAGVDEAWHWVHPEKKIVGIEAFQKITGFEVVTGDAAAAAADMSVPGTVRLLNLEIYEKTAGLARGKGGASRQSLLYDQSIYGVRSANGGASFISQMDPAALLVLPKAFEKATLGPFSYNFTTGLWGDNEPV